MSSSLIPRGFSIQAILSFISSAIRPQADPSPSMSSGTSSTEKSLRKTFLGFEDIWHLVMENLSYHDLLSASEALPIVNRLLDQHKARRQQVFLEPAGPVVASLSFHPDLILNDEVGRRFHRVTVFASPAVINLMQEEVERINIQIDNDMEWLDNIDPDDKEDHSWDIQLSGRSQQLLRETQLFSYQARIDPSCVKPELENQKSQELQLHPEIFKTAIAKDGQYRELQFDRDGFTLLNGKIEDLEGLYLYWQKSLLTQPPTSSVEIRYQISHVTFVGAVSGRKYALIRRSYHKAHVINCEGVRLRDLQSLLLGALKEESRSFRVAMLLDQIQVTVTNLILTGTPTTALREAMRED
ncbi:uncharacterized protein BKA78DRAFT_300806 [Phyllosticta capitalensis]|uniref:uncharacterized protein n=1 Tax=Phyllosticta capitalensis TaxID=121624 RepID=UPI00312EE364